MRKEGIEHVDLSEAKARTLLKNNQVLVSNLNFRIMAQTGISGNYGESLVNIFPNPCIGETYLYTDDLEAAWVCIRDMDGNAQVQSVIDPGKTLHLHLSLKPGNYQLILKDHFNNVLGQPKMLYISEQH